MAKERVIKQLTDEQRQEILRTPGVVVRKRDPLKKGSEFVPAIHVDRPVPVRELLGRDDDFECESE